MPTDTSRTSRALNAIRDLVNSGRPLVYLLSPEEGRLTELLRSAARSMFSAPVPLFTWSSTEGMRGEDGAPISADGASARAALDFVAQHTGGAVFHLKDFHQPMRESAQIVRRLRDIYAACLDTGKFVFISSPVQYVPEEINRELVVVDVPLPDHAELMTFLAAEAQRLSASGVRMEATPDLLVPFARALQGLTIDESRHALRRAAAAQSQIDTSSLPILLEEKHLLVKKKTAVLEYVPHSTTLEELGGVPYLKRWLIERRRLFEQRDALSADIVPKGLLIMGISGCGKSLAVKSVATCFQLPLYRVNMSEIFSGREGNPESTFARACKTMEEMAPAVAWFDEIEMGITAHGEQSAGTLGRIFAYFLTWMQEKARGLFVGATANRIDLLPAEMIRKGRFDEVFFVDLPSEEDRLEIFRIHLSKRGMDPDQLELDRLRQFTRGWTGAEIEQCVVSALTTASLSNRPMNADDLLNTTAKIVPLSKTMKEQVEHIRGWALDRAVRAAPRGGERG
jgi:SpoVK/Ycf46/Vps4 family AAA+-type ATPase